MKTAFKMKTTIIVFLILGAAGACNNYGLLEKLENPGSSSNKNGASSMIAFLSSTTINASLSNTGTISTLISAFPACNALIGLPLADCACTQMASMAGLPMPANQYVAWISSSSNDMSCRINGTLSPLVGCSIPTGGPTWTTTGGQTVANGYAGLFSGSLMSPINMTETKAIITSNVWTGTNASGTSGSAATSTCTDWTAASSGIYGNSGVSTGGWTNTTSTACGATPYPFYCFGRP